MTVTSNAKTAMQNSKEHEESKNRGITKNNNNLLVTKFKDTKFCNLPDKEFEIDVWKTQGRKQKND